MNSHMSYTKADCCCFCENVSWEKRARCGWFAVASPRYCWAEPREGTGKEKRGKTCGPGNQQPSAHQELGFLSVTRTNEGPTGHTVHACIKGKAKLKWSSQPGSEGWSLPREQRRLLVPRGCAGAPGGTGRDSRKRGPWLHKCAQLSTKFTRSHSAQRLRREWEVERGCIKQLAFPQRCV